MKTNHFLSINSLASAIAVLLLVCHIGGGLLLVHLEQMHSLASEESLAASEIDMLTEVISNSLWRSNYEMINPYIQKWGTEHQQDVAEIRLIAANGFELSHFVRNQPASRPFPLQRQIDYSYESRVTLEMVKDFAAIHEKTGFHKKIVFATVLVTVALYLLTYWVIKERVKTDYFKKESDKLAKLTRELEQEVESRRKAEAVINQSFSTLDQIFNTAAGGMRVIDNDFNMVKVNDTFLEMSGISRDMLLHRKCYEVFSGPGCHTDRCPLLRIQQGEQRIEDEVTKERTDGSSLICLVTATPFKDSNGTLLGIIEDFRNISDRKQLENQLLAQKEREARQAALIHSGRLAALGEMATAMAHEIHQPLSVISIAVQGWELRHKRGGFTVEAALKDITSIKRNIQRIAQLIEHVRTFGRTENTSELTEITKVIEDALSMCRNQLQNRNITLEEQYDTDIPKVRIVSAEIEQVLLNLLSNARQAVEEAHRNNAVQPRISLRLHQDDEAVIITIEDNGDGVPPAKIDYIFDPFFTTKPSSMGTGLGLNISKQIMVKYGDLHLDNHPGVGATFHVRIRKENSKTIT